MSDCQAFAVGDASKRQHDRLGRLKDSGKEIEGIESLSDRGEQDRHDPFLSKGAVPSSVHAADLFPCRQRRDDRSAQQADRGLGHGRQVDVRQDRERAVAAARVVIIFGMNNPGSAESQGKKGQQARVCARQKGTHGGVWADESCIVEQSAPSISMGIRF